MLSVTFEILFILLLILANGVLAMSEIAVVSARKARLQQRTKGGDQRAQAALDLANNPSSFLSTVQIGITLVGILAGAFGGATIAEEIAPLIAQVTLLAPYSDAIGFALIVLVITYFSLVLGELAPKRIALEDPEGIASAVAAPMHWLARLAFPLVRLLSASTNLVVRILGIRPANEPPVTEEEVKVLIDMGTRAGVFEKEEQDLVEGVFRMADRRLESIMTHRSEIIWIDLEAIDEARQKIIHGGHTRFPVARGSLDHVVGIVHAKDLLARALDNQQLDLQAAMLDPLFVPENALALNLLERFREYRGQIALVIDEFGGVQGLVTSFDLLEGIAGDIPLLGEAAEPEIVKRGEGSWLVDGKLSIEEFRDYFEIRKLPDEESDHYQTLGGLVMTILGHVPTTGDRFEFADLRFEVIDMDGFRVDKVLVERIQGGVSEDSEAASDLNGHRKSPDRG